MQSNKVPAPKVNRAKAKTKRVTQSKPPRINTPISNAVAKGKYLSQ